MLHAIDQADEMTAVMADDREGWRAPVGFFIPGTEGAASPFWCACRWGGFRSNRFRESPTGYASAKRSRCTRTGSTAMKISGRFRACPLDRGLRHSQILPLPLGLLLSTEPQPTQ